MSAVGIQTQQSKPTVGRNGFARAAIAGAVLMLAGCVSAFPTPPAELLSGLTPTNADNAKTEENLVDNVAEVSEEQLRETQKTALASTAAPRPAQDAVETVSADDKKPKPKAAADKGSNQTEPAQTDTPSDESKPEQIEVSAPAPKPAPKKTNFLASFFQSNDINKGRKANKTKTAKAQSSGRAVKRPKVSINTRSGSVTALPGVRTKGLFGIFNANDQSNEDLDEPFDVASVSNLARRGNFGLLLQTPKVKVHCFPKSLVRILKQVERKYGRTPIVTSGYRSRAKNRSIRGARNSTHISCKAADIQVKGISKWQLAKYLRSLPGRGGVGTYCHTKSVHIDIGKKRDWNWRCRRKKRRKA